jgi:hypothetical protein
LSQFTPGAFFMMRIWTRLLCLTAIVTLAGCGGGSGRGAVLGQVTVNGQPLEAGEIAFVSTSPTGGPTAGAPIQNGKYQITADQGPLGGEHQVQIRAFRRTGKKLWDGMGDERAPATSKTFVEELEQYVPARYNEASELRAAIVAGQTNKIDFDLQSPTAAPQGK